MRPYYERAGVALYHCRHEELVAHLGGDAADAIITDPPYGETALEWDRWPPGWPGLVRPLLKRAGSMWCFGSFRMWWEKRDEFIQGGWKVAEDVVWEKNHGTGFTRDRFMRVHEQPVHFYRADSPWRAVWKSVPVTMDAVAKKVKAPANRFQHRGAVGVQEFESKAGGPRLMRSVLKVKSMRNQGATNETQKPVALVEPLVLNACPPDGTVVDFFSGSGSTALACLATGRRFIGCDMREDQCEHAARALSQVLLLGGVG